MFLSILQHLQKVIEAAIGGILEKKVFLNILENLQKNTCVGVSSLAKLQASDLQLYFIKKDTSDTAVFL